MNSEILVKLQKIFRQYFDDPELLLFETTSARDIEEWDSLAQVGLILSIEKEFNLRFSIEDIESLENIGGMEKLIERLSQ